MKAYKAIIQCSICGGEARFISKEREIQIRDRVVVALDEFYRCGSCEEEYYLPGMMDAVLLRAKERIRAEDA